jgi:hypothetical protein
MSRPSGSALLRKLTVCSITPTCRPGEHRVPADVVSA